MKHQKDIPISLTQKWMIRELAEKLGYTYMVELFDKKDLTGITHGQYWQILRLMVNDNDGAARAYKLISKYPDLKADETRN
jgi:hypothetical protein